MKSDALYLMKVEMAFVHILKGHCIDILTGTKYQKPSYGSFSMVRKLTSWRAGRDPIAEYTLTVLLLLIWQRVTAKMSLTHAAMMNRR